MRTKISLFSIALVFTLFATILLLPGCEVDYYDPEANPGTGNSLFGDSVTIPAGFDWSTMRTITVSVKVDDRYHGDYYYTVELFDSNPLFDANANLLSKGVAKANMDYKASVVIPASIETIYIQQTNPTGGKTIAPVNISSSSSVDYTFTTVGTTTRFSSVQNENETAPGYSFRSATDKYAIPALPANHTVITQTSGNVSRNLSDGTILFNGNFSGTINFWGKGDIFVSGTLNVTRDNLPVPDGSRLIILPGGSVTTPDVNSWGIVEVYVAGTLTVNNQFGVPANSKGIVLQGGTLTCNTLDIKSLFYNNGQIHVTDLIKTNNSQAEILNDNVIQAKQFEIATEGAKLNNNGTIVVAENLKVSNRNGNITNTNSITAQSLTFENGTMENEGVIFIEGHTKATNSNVLLINNNRFTTNTMYVSSSAMVQNNCHLTVNDQLELEDAKITINQGGLLTTSYLTMNNTRIELNSAAMMHVTTLATYNYNGNTGHGFYGTGSNKALLKLEKATYNKKNDEKIIHYQGNLEIECYDHPAEVLDNTRKRWTQSGITWAGAGGSTLVIAATECNNGGYNNTPPTPPSNPVFPIIYEGSVVTYLFEDGWPYLGDFDMNDLVMDLTPTYSTDANNKVTQLRLDIVLRAIGATKRLAAGLQLDGVSPSAITNVTRSNSAGANGSVFSVGTNGLEQGQAYAVIPLFDVVHEALGRSSSVMTNTIKGSPNSVSSLSVPFTILFNMPIDKASVGLEKFNVFLVNGGYKAKRQEVHMAGFKVTDKADYSKFGFADDNSNVEPYTSKGNLIWGLAIPGSAKYPAEWTSIKVAYPEFESWATSGGATNMEWYKNHNLNAIYE